MFSQEDQIQNLSLIQISNLVKPEHIKIFSSWIDKKDSTHYNKRNIPYKFNLLYRASRDGNTAAAFHENCDNKGATIVVAKIKNSEQIVGGYNPLDWNGNGPKSTNDSFLFSFSDRNNPQSAKVGYCNNSQRAVYCKPGNGPIFGNGHDLCCCNNGTWFGKPASYPKVDDIQNDKNFKVDDYEVFQVIKM